MKCERLAFELGEPYDEREVEDLLELLQSRGADYKRDQGARYHLFIPLGMDYKPFYETLKDCSSVRWVDDILYPTVFIPVDVEG